MKYMLDKAHVCSHNHSIFLDNFIRRLFQNPTKITKGYINEGDTVIDLGCGSGFFTTDMATMVGKNGKVYAVDLQKEMLTKLVKKLERYNLKDRVVIHQCKAGSISLEKVGADFILAYYMVHETPDHKTFLKEVRSLLKPDGKFLMVEPPFHVSKKKFNQISQSAIEVGFNILDRPCKKGGMSLLLTH